MWGLCEKTHRRRLPDRYGGRRAPRAHAPQWGAGGRCKPAPALAASQVRTTPRLWMVRDDAYAFIHRKSTSQLTNYKLKQPISPKHKERINKPGPSESFRASLGARLMNRLVSGPVSAWRGLTLGESPRGRGPRRVAPVRRAGRSTVQLAFEPATLPRAQEALTIAAHTGACTTPTGSPVRRCNTAMCPAGPPPGPLPDGPGGQSHSTHDTRTMPGPHSCPFEHRSG